MKDAFQRCDAERMFVNSFRLNPLEVGSHCCLLHFHELVLRITTNYYSMYVYFENRRPDKKIIIIINNRDVDAAYYGFQIALTLRKYILMRNILIIT